MTGYDKNFYHYASAMPITKQTILALGTANNSTSRSVFITDVKMTCATAVNVKFYVSSYAAFGKDLDFNLPANSITNFSWNTPVKMYMVSSTVEPRRFVASAAGTGVKYSITGYFE